MEVGILGVRQVLVGVDAHRAALTMLIGLRVDAADQLHISPAPGALDSRAEGTAVDVGRHRPGHHPGAGRCAQGVVVHDVVGVVVVDLRFEFFHHVADVGFLKTQAEAFALELRAVHAAPGVTRLTVALAGSQLQQGVGIRGPAECDVAVPFVIARRDGVVVAIPIVVGMRGVADHSHVTQRSTGSGVDHFVETAVGAGQYAGVHPCAEFAEAFRLAVEEDGARRSTRAPEHGLRAFDHGQFVVGFRRDVRGWRVHPPRAGAEHHAAVGEDVQARTEHAAQHRVTVGAAIANLGETRNGLQIVRAIAGRHRLARVFRVGNDGQR
ncbi:hypothetical protein D3C86_1275580 [compost metagenome]